MTLTLDIPSDVAEDKLVRAAVALYDARILTQGQAAEMAGLSRVEFFDTLGRYGVSPFQYDWQEAVADADLLAEREAGNR